MDGDEVAARDEALDDVRPDTAGDQLPSRNDPLLAIRKRPGEADGSVTGRFAAHTAVNPPLNAGAPRVASRGMADGEATLRPVAPGRLWPWVKRASWFELGLFAALVVFWLLPGFDGEAMAFGWAHGLGFVALAILIWVAVLRHEAPYTLLAATLTPVGPLGSVIAIAWIERRRPPA